MQGAGSSDVRRWLRLGLWCALLLATSAHAARDAGATDAAVAMPDAGLAVVVPGSDAGAPPDLAVDAGARSAADPIARLVQQREAIELLIAGRVPDRLTTTQLFLVDVRDEAAVARRRGELEAQLARMKAAQGNALLDAGASIAAAELALADARLRFLALPAARRLEVLDAEANAVARAVAREAAEQQQVAAASERAAAEAAQQAALEAASQAEEAERRSLATERARLESIRIELASARERLAAREAEHLERAQAQAAQLQSLKSQAAAVAPRGSDADGLYDVLVTELVAGRKAWRAALDALGDYTRQPRAELGKPATDGDPDLEPERRALAELVAAINAQAGALEGDERQLAFDEAEAWADHVRALNDVRLTLLHRLSRDKERRVLGLGRDGRDQFVRELEQLRLSAEWRREAEGKIIDRFLRGMRDPFAAAEAVVRLLALVGLAVLARFLSRRLPRWLRLSRTLVVRHVQQASVARWLLNVIDALAAIAPELVLLASVLVLGWIAAPILDRPLLFVPYTIVFDYAIYRLAIRAAHRLIGWLAWTPLGALSEAKSELVLRSVRVVGLYTFFLNVFLMVSETILGRGYLYSVAARFGWLGAIPIGWVLMGWWREDIAGAYLKLQPDGRLADLVRRSREQTRGFLFSTAALVVLFIAWLGRTARRFVLRFDQTRKALAYVFRKRLERRAGERGEDQEEVAPPTIPDEVLALFQPTPVDRETFAIDRYPELDEFAEALAEWQEREEMIGAWLVVGRTGFGKTSWLNAAAGRVGEIDVVRLDLTQRLGSPEELVASLAKAAGIDATNALALSAALASGPRRVFVIDELQNLMLRRVGRMAVWDTLTAIIHQAGPRVFWLGAIAYQPFQYLEWARRGHGAFRHIVRLKRWSEGEIRELIEARTEATGWQVSYQDLLVARIDDRSDGAHVVQTAQEFTRLIWDYAEGSPRVALDCWVRALVHDGEKRLRVKLFPRPRDAVLEEIDETTRFALGAVVWHENVTSEEAASSLGLPESDCHDGLRRLAEEGVLVETEGRYRVTVAWWPVVNRFLIRKHLILS